MQPLLRIRDLTVRYTATAAPTVAGVSLDLLPGGAVAIVGESGSGKSTTVLAATRLLPPAAVVTSAELMLAGEDILDMQPRRLREVRKTKLAMVFQDPTGNWNPTRTIAAQLLDGLRGKARRERRAVLVETMTRVGIPDPEHRIDDLPHHFSGGMAQRAMLAAGLVHKPSLLIADEPTSALDTTVQAELLRLIDQLRAEERLSLLLISHDLGVVSRMAEQTIVLYAGGVVEKGQTADILRAPAHPYTVDLLAATPRLRGPKQDVLPVGRFGAPSTDGCAYATRCTYATDRCRVERPDLREIDGVEVACHHAPVQTGAAA
jgi:oligopeptide/dipeptide ABC transporter ATP-binding protein